MTHFRISCCRVSHLSAFSLVAITMTLVHCCSVSCLDYCKISRLDILIHTSIKAPQSFLIWTHLLLLTLYIFIFFPHATLIQNKTNYYFLHAKLSHLILTSWYSLYFKTSLALLVSKLFLYSHRLCPFYGTRHFLCPGPPNKWWTSENFSDRTSESSVFL